MAFFNIKRKEVELTPEQLNDEIKNVKEQIKACRSEISQLKSEHNSNIKVINEKIEVEKENFEKEVKRITSEKDEIVKKAKAFEKNKSLKLKEAKEENEKVNAKLDEVREVTNQKIEKKLKDNKKALQTKLAQIESEFNSNKDALENEHKKTIDNLNTLIAFEENAIKEAKEEKDKIIEKYEAKLLSLEDKKNNISESFEKSVDTLNKQHETKVEALSNKASEMLSKQKSDLKQLYLDLDTITEKRNKLKKEYDDERNRLQNELDTLIAKNEVDVINATKLNESLETDLKQEQAELDSLIEHHNQEYAELKFFLGTLVEKIPDEVKSELAVKKQEYDSKEKELSKRVVELRKQFDAELKERNSVLDNEINDLKLSVEKNSQTYTQIIKENENRNDNLVKDYQHSLETVTKEKESLLNEIRSLETSYKEQIKTFNNQLNDTKANNKIYLDQLKTKYATEVQDLIASYESQKSNKINELKNELKEVKDEIRALSTDFKIYSDEFNNKTKSLISQNEKEINTLASKRESLNTSIRLLNDEVDAKREIFAKDIAAINAKIENVKNERIVKLQALEEENNEKLIALQAEYDNKFIELQKESDEKIQKANLEADEKKNDLAAKHQINLTKFNKRKEEIENDAEDIKNKFETQINKVLDQQNELTNQVNTLRENLDNSEDLFKQELEFLNLNFDVNKNKIEEDYNTKINEVIKQYEEIPAADVESLRSQLEAAKANYANLNVELLEKKNQMQTDYDVKKGELIAKQDEISREIEKKNDLFNELAEEKEAEYQAQVERVNEKKEQLEILKNEIKEETDKIQNEQNESLAKLTEDYNRKYDETVVKYNEEEMILRDRLEGEIQYVTRDYDRKKADLDAQLNEVTMRKDQIETDLKSRYNVELEKNKSLENEVRLLQEDINFKKVSYDTQLENKKKEFDDETVRLQAKRSEDLLAQKAHYSDVLAELQVKKEQLTKEIDLLAYEYNDKAKAVEHIRQSQSKDLSLLRIQLTQLIEQFNKNDVFGEKQAKLELMHDRRIAEIKKDFAIIVNEFDNLQATKEGIGNLSKSSELEITRKAEEFKRVLASLDVKHDETMAELKNQYEVSLKQISEDFKLYIQGNKGAIEDCENEIISLQTTYDNLIKEEEIKLAKLDAEKTLHNKQIEMIQSQFDAKMKQVEDGYAEMSDEDKIKAEYTFETERRSYENQIQALKDEINRLEQPKPALNLKIRDLSKQKSELEEDMFVKKQKLIELLDEAFNKIVINYKDRVLLKKSQLKEYDIYDNNKTNIFK